MQDNLEFVQWLKKFWNENFPGGEYDAMSRRKAVSTRVTHSRTSDSSSTSKRNYKFVQLYL